MKEKNLKLIHLYANSYQILIPNSSWMTHGFEQSFGLSLDHTVFQSDR